MNNEELTNDSNHIPSEGAAKSPSIGVIEEVIGSVSEIDQLLNKDGLAEITIGEKIICIGKHRDQLYAFAARCPHAGGRMCAGYIDALGNVVCPVHRYKFSMRSGRNTSGEEFYLKIYPLEMRGDQVYVKIR